MTPLRQRMIEDLQLRGLSERTQEMYVHAVTPMPRNSVQDALRAALQASGIHTRASVHTLRHSWAAHLLEAGVHLRLIQHSLGHHSPSTTALSTHLTATAEAMATETINRLLEALSWPWEVCHARTGGNLPTLWPGIPRHMRRPRAPQPSSRSGGH